MNPHLILLIALLLGSFSPAHDDLKDVTGQHDDPPVDPKLAPSFAPGRIGSAVVTETVNAGIELANPSAIDFRWDWSRGR